VAGAAGEASGRSPDLKPAGQWNRLRATLKGDSLQATVNGKSLTQTKLANVPAKGAFGLRTRVEMEFGNLFVHESEP
jgi:hypothetical protein